MTKTPRNSRQTTTAASCLVKVALTLSCGLASSLTMAQQRYLLEGIFDTELYHTDPDSRLLSRNDGDLAILGRLQLWSAFQITPGLQIYALAEIETDNSGGTRETEAELEQFALRYTSQTSPYYFLEAGKILSPLAAFSNRHLSTQNPLIRQPYIFTTSYPVGVQVAGSAGWFDYRAAFLDLPDMNPEYIVSEPDSAYRPALGLGVTPFTGLRLGLTYTKGPYLNRQLDAYLPPGTGWRDFDQRVWGFDFQFSRGYLELNGQLVGSRYEVPFHAQHTDETAYYLELKYTWTPRFYGAARFGKNEATFISHTGDLSWIAPTGKFSDLEVGFGYRFSPYTLFKVAYSYDHWSVDDTTDDFPRNGHALGFQLSYNFDLGSRFAEKP